MEYDWVLQEAASLAKVNLDEVEEVVRYYEGYNESEDWLWVLKMKDGQWCHIAGWCDYTGWDCQAGAEAFYAPAERQLASLHITAESRRKLGYE
jgi:NADH:ubiquinone oxidoreductase subunit E